MTAKGVISGLNNSSDNRRETRLTVPQRPSHLPNHAERNALQMLNARGALSSKNLYPTGAPTLSKMVAKAWIDRIGTDTYAITPSGLAALKARLPEDNRSSG
jgi:hypothetical protein